MASSFDKGIILNFDIVRVGDVNVIDHTVSPKALAASQPRMAVLRDVPQ